MILNVCAKFPGSTHDSHIWRLSPVEGLMKQLHAIGQTSYFLLGTQSQFFFIVNNIFKVFNILYWQVILDIH